MGRITDNYAKRDFWIQENTLYVTPNFRLRRCARLLNESIRDRDADLLDVGCGPAALRALLDPNIRYHGIDIAPHARAPYLRELDFAVEPIRFDDKVFDVVVALGVFEYLGRLQAQKLSEISRIMKPDGVFVMSYLNFGHFRRKIYPTYNNMQSIDEIAAALRRVFRLERHYPISHHWRHRQPGRNAAPFQPRIQRAIPFVSPWLAVEYLFVCTRR